MNVFSRRWPLIAIVALAVVALVAVIATQAGGQPAAIEAEGAQLAEPAGQVDDAAASGDRSIVFDVESEPNNPELVARINAGWCAPVVRTLVTARDDSVVNLEPGDDIQSAINSLTAGSVRLGAGTYTIGTPLQLKSNVSLVGNSTDTVITTTQAMDSMVSIGGGFTASGGPTLARAERGATEVEASSGELSPGLWLIGDPGAGQLVRVVSVNGSVAQLELPLVQDFTGLSINLQRDPVVEAGISNLTLRPDHRVQDLIFLRSVDRAWVSGVGTDGAGGQVRSAIFMRQTYGVQLVNNQFNDAAEHGDGGQGYGINVANNASSSWISSNDLQNFRHSILLQGGASGNVVMDNTSSNSKHPNFVEGGPADISFHGYASGNLAQGNEVERIQINDAGTPGPYNMIAYNRLTSGPLTLDNGVDDVSLVGNQTLGDVETLRTRIMPSIATDSTAGNPSPERPFWTLGYDPFEGPGGSETQFTEREAGILDWGSGSNVLIDSGDSSRDVCSLI